MRKLAHSTFLMIHLLLHHTITIILINGYQMSGDLTVSNIQQIPEILLSPPSISSEKKSSLASTFKIALFADLHYGENAWTDWGPQQDVKSDKVMSTVLDEELPDFVIYLGDVITGNSIPVANASLYWDQAICPTRSRGIPWATIFGNHDDAHFEWPMEWFSPTGVPQVQCLKHCSTDSGILEKACNFKGTTRLELIKNEIHKNKQYSFTKNGPTNLWPSVSNYVIQVSSFDGRNRHPIIFLYFLDSGGGSFPEVISSAQATWFENQSYAINNDSRVPELIFWHIPSKAYKDVAPRFGIHRPCVGSINKESVATQGAEMGIMNILANKPSVKAVFVGHNHGLDWCCPHEKLWLCFARHTGYGGYGDWPRGARMIKITEKPFSIKSWIKMEDGKKHSQIVLS